MKEQQLLHFCMLHMYVMTTISICAVVMTFSICHVMTTISICRHDDHFHAVYMYVPPLLLIDLQVLAQIFLL